MQPTPPDTSTSIHTTFNTQLNHIWSVNEWGHLREIIIGNPHFAHIPALTDLSQLSFDRPEPQDQPDPGTRPMPKWVIDETTEDIQQLQQLLQNLGVRVHHAAAVDCSFPVRSPDWTADQEHSINIRDITLIHGNLIIDAASPTRGRCYERCAVADLFHSYLRRRPGRYTGPPRPRLTDATYDLSRSRGINELEPLFDAANCVRLGRDLIIDINNTANQTGAVWLQQALDQHYGPNSIRVHCTHLSPDHLDVIIVPLCEGVAMINPKYVQPHFLPGFLKNWKLIEAAEMVPQTFHSGTPKASNWIGLNLLVVDGTEKTVIVEERQLPLIRQLELHGFHPLPTRWRHGRTWGGGFHCVTLDVHREGEL